MGPPVILYMHLHVALFSDVDFDVLCSWLLMKYATVGCVFRFNWCQQTTIEELKRADNNLTNTFLLNVICISTAVLPKIIVL